MIDRDSKASHGQHAADATSTSLLGRAKAGEGEAWGRLVELYSPLLYEWCRRSGLQADDAADVAQDVFAEVSKKIKSFHRDRPGDSFRGWLWTIARNKIHDHFRKLKGLPKAQGGTDAQARLAAIPEPSAGLSASSLPDDSASSKNSAWCRRLATASCNRTSSVWAIPLRRNFFRHSTNLAFIVLALPSELE
jgi:RNA polymerase sigma-70 factor (ECF subfamily)